MWWKSIYQQVINLYLTEVPQTCINILKKNKVLKKITNLTSNFGSKGYKKHGLIKIELPQPGARIRYVKKDKNGTPDSKLSWDLQEGIEFGPFTFLAWDGTDPAGTQLLADGTYSYDFPSNCGCNKVSFFFFFKFC